MGAPGFRACLYKGVFLIATDPPPVRSRFSPFVYFGFCPYPYCFFEAERAYGSLNSSSFFFKLADKQGCILFFYLTLLKLRSKPLKYFLSVRNYHYPRSVFVETVDDAGTQGVGAYFFNFGVFLRKKIRNSFLLVISRFFVYGYARRFIEDDYILTGDATTFLKASDAQSDDLADGTGKCALSPPQKSPRPRHLFRRQPRGRTTHPPHRAFGSGD